MKKLIAILLTLSLFVSVCAFAEGTDNQENVYTLQGEVIGLSEDGILIATPDGDYLVHNINDQIQIEGQRYSEGSMITVYYDGKTTKDIPAQITATKISCYYEEGIVTAIEEDVLTLDTVNGLVLVTLPENVMIPDIDTSVRVYFDGIMALSYPGRITALKIDAITPVFTLNGYVVGSNENGIILNTAEYGEVEVHTTESTLFELVHEITIGQYVQVYYNGVMSRSIPAQITADRIVCYILNGIVTTVNEDDHSVIIDSTEYGEVEVRFDEEVTLPVMDEEISVTYNGIMTMSLPGQINAIYWETVPNEKARN